MLEYFLVFINFYHSYALKKQKQKNKTHTKKNKKNKKQNKKQNKTKTKTKTKQNKKTCTINTLFFLLQSYNTNTSD